MPGVLRAAAGLALCLWLGLGSVRVAAAQDEGYDEIVAEALAEFRASHYLESRKLFAQAHRLKPSARTLRGMGQAAFGAQLYAQTIVDLSAALDSDVNKLTPKMRQEAEKIIARARSYSGRFWVTLDPPDAEISVDGEHPIFDRDGALLLDVGARQVLVRAKGRVDRETAIQVAGGEEKNLDLRVSIEPKSNDTDDVAPVSDEAPALQMPPAIKLTPRPQRPVQRASNSTLPWLAVGAFGIAAAGIGTGIWALQLRETRVSSWTKQGCIDNGDDPTCQWFQAEWQKATTWEVISFSLAGAFAATGIVLLIIHGNKDSETALACGTMGDIGLQCRLRM